MIFKEFVDKVLKLFGKGSLIQVKIDNRKTMNLYNINSPMIQSSEKNLVFSDFKDRKKELFDINKVGFIRDDLVSAEMALIALPENYRKMLKEMRPHLNTDDYAALIMAYGIRKLNNEANLTEGEKLRENLKRKFGERGNRINNIVAVGHFEMIIYPRLQSIMQDQIIADKGKEFREFFDRMINLFPFAIWVNEAVSKENLLLQVKVRLKNLGATQISIHSAGSNNMLVEWLATEIRERQYDMEITKLRES